MREPDALIVDANVPNRHVETNGFTVVADRNVLHVPATVVDIESFREWTDTDDFPEKMNIWWLCGGVWIDMSHEQIFTHVVIEGEIFRVLASLVRQNRLGWVFPDGAFLTNLPADISGKPDAMFLSEAAVESDRVRFVEGAKGGYNEIEGTPDMVLEVVSDSSVRKDLIILLDAYWQAGIREYWLVDARDDQLKFDIFRHGPKGYKRSAKKHGWIASPVFGKSFRLSMTTDAAGRPDYTLEVR